MGTSRLSPHLPNPLEAMLDSFIRRNMISPDGLGLGRCCIISSHKMGTVRATKPMELTLTFLVRKACSFCFLVSEGESNFLAGVSQWDNQTGARGIHRGRAGETSLVVDLTVPQEGHGGSCSSFSFGIRRSLAWESDCDEVEISKHCTLKLEAS